MFLTKPKLSTSFETQNSKLKLATRRFWVFVFSREERHSFVDSSCRAVARDVALVKMPPPQPMPRRRWRPALTAAVALLSAAAAVHADMEPIAAIAAARRLIDDTKSDMFHLDLQARGTRSGGRQEEGSESLPWSSGFVPGREAAGAVTIGHPIRRMLVHFKEEGVGLEEALSWGEGEGR